MSRADRLFQLVQLLRGRRFATAEALAEELAVSKRTLYRDIRELQNAGVPVRGEAGVGYALERGYELPPMRFTSDEVEALALGARMVEAWGDPELSEAARALQRKLSSSLPEALRRSLIESPLHAADWGQRQRWDLGPLRRAISAREKLRLAYRDSEGELTERIICPLGLVFWGRNWSLAAWCELRQDYRSFRPDRIEDMDSLQDGFSAAITMEAYLARR
jgi:predicted DNA-binding transcriptional regulator YafY